MKKPIYILLGALLLAVTLLSDCTNSPDEKQEVIISLEKPELRALSLLQTNCFNCHNPSVGVESRIAPPMNKVREHYLEEGITKEQFVEKMVYFVNNPAEENSIMPGAVRNFGVMPKLSFKESDIELMSEYIYENNLESENWLAKWEVFLKSDYKPENNLTFADKALNIANGTKSVLGKNLMGAVKNLGPEGAVEFCNIRAIPITDSMSRAFDIRIKRVSDKPRNPGNQASEEELNYIHQLKADLANGIKTPPQISESEGKKLGYFAIETNAMCLKCHGEMGTEIAKNTSRKITKLYPEDKAIGYGENEIRGIWVVETAD